MKSQENSYTIVVTGASGYLGAKVVRKLRHSGKNVVGIDFLNSDINLDLSTPRLIFDHKIKEKYVLIHLASRLPGTVGGTQLESENHFVVENLARNLNPVRSLFMSSTAVYDVKMKEEFPVVQPWEVYGKSKFQAEKLMHQSFKNLTILRSGTLFDNERGGAISKIVRRGQNGKTVMLPNEGRNHHPFTSTMDVVNFIHQWVDSEVLFKPIYDLVCREPLSFHEIFSLGCSRPKIQNIPTALLSKIGSDKFPIMGISAWHLNALNYDLIKFQHQPEELELSSSKQLFQSI